MCGTAGYAANGIVGVAGVIGLGGVADTAGRPGLMLTGGAAPPGTKTLAFGLRTNSFAFGFKVDFFADEVGVDDADGGDGAVSRAALAGAAAASVSDFWRCSEFGDKVLA
jgi:hypothetical protein